MKWRVEQTAARRGMPVIKDEAGRTVCTFPWQSENRHGHAEEIVEAHNNVHEVRAERIASLEAENAALRRAIMGREPDPSVSHGQFLEMARTLHVACDGGRVRAEAAEAALSAEREKAGTAGGEYHGLDTPERVCFYEQDFYVLSNFSSFMVCWDGLWFQTSEHLYHWLKFATSADGRSTDYQTATEVAKAPSAHQAFKIAESNRHLRRPDWDDVKVDIMRSILRAKADQHEYVRRKLLATGNRQLVENSWRDDFWGWGPNRDGQNMLGKLWMEIREELRCTALVAPSEKDIPIKKCRYCDGLGSYNCFCTGVLP